MIAGALKIWRTFTPTTWSIIGLLALLAISVTTCRLVDAGRRAADLERDRAVSNNQVLTRDRTAADQAANERLADHDSNLKRQQERADAVSAYPDARPSDRGIARGCVQLRQQGTRDADLPAVCRSQGR